MEINVFEHEYAFSADKLSFPSISACRAVVLQTSDGLFGLHQAIGPYPEKWKQFGEKFAEFLRGHRLGKGIGINMYAVAYLDQPNTGYKNRQEHFGEMKAYASEIGYKGSFHCYDLSTAISGAGSAYVEVAVNGGTCNVSASRWTRPGPGHVPFNSARSDDHKWGYYKNPGFKAPKDMLVDMKATNPIKLESWCVFSC